MVTNLEGQFICQVGSSEEGLLDGPFDAALFNRPQVRKQLLLPYNRYCSYRNMLFALDICDRKEANRLRILNE